jgi:4-amino-4-deoxy-L-arabinose transferase-like glycosyltransferase
VTNRIHNLLVRRPDIVIWLVFGYFALSVALRLLRSDGLQSDEAEQAFQAQFLLLGYGRQPPAYNWLQMGVFELFGVSIATLSILKNFLLFLCCLVYAGVARLLVDDRRLPLVAMLGVLAIPSVSVLAQRDLTHAIATLCLVSCYLYAFVLTLKRPSLTHYLLLGVTVGIGVITKYNFVILPLAATLAVLPEPDFRRRLLDWRILAAAAVAAAIATPHLLWALNHMEAATAGTVDAMRSDASGDALKDITRGLTSIFLATIEASAPVIVLFSLVFFPDIKRVWRAQDRWTGLIGRMILACIVIVALIGIGFGASSIRQKWLSPFLLLLPLYLTLKLSAAQVDSRQSVARMAPPVLVIVTAFIVYLALSTILSPMFGKFGKENLPYRTALEDIFKQRDERPAYIITDDLLLAGNSRIHWSSVPVAIPGAPEPPPIARAERQRAGLLVWQMPEAGTGLPEQLQDLLRAHGRQPETIAISTIAVPYALARKGETMRFGYAWLEPAPEAQR